MDGSDNVRPEAQQRALRGANSNSITASPAIPAGAADRAAITAATGGLSWRHNHAPLHLTIFDVILIQPGNVPSILKSLTWQKRRRWQARNRLPYFAQE